MPGLEVVAPGVTQNRPGTPNGGTYNATLSPGSRGNIVFNASTCWWGDGLSAPPGYKRPFVYTTPQGPTPARAAHHGQSAGANAQRIA